MPDGLDLTAANAGALADIAAASAATESTPAAEAAPAAEAQAPLSGLDAQEAASPGPVAATEEATEATPAAAEATPAVPEDTTPAQKWTFTRKGQEVTITDPQQAADLIRQGYDYTQKTMELAETRRAMEAQVRNLLTNRELLAAQLAHLQAQEPAPTAQTPPARPDPDDLLSVAQAEQLVVAKLQQAQAANNQALQQQLLAIETARYTEEYTGAVNATLATLLNDKYPVLKDVDKIEKLILDDVAEQVQARVLMEPEKVVPIDDVKTMLAQAAKRRHDRIDARIKEHVKMQAVRAAKTAKEGIEPPGGAATAPAAPATTYKLGDPRLTALAIQDLMGSGRK